VLGTALLTCVTFLLLTVCSPLLSVGVVMLDPVCFLLMRHDFYENVFYRTYTFACPLCILLCYLFFRVVVLSFCLSALHFVMRPLSLLVLFSLFQAKLLDPFKPSSAIALPTNYSFYTWYSFPCPCRSYSLIHLTSFFRLCSRFLDIQSYRKKFWWQQLLWPDQLPRNSTVILSEHDELVCAFAAVDPLLLTFLRLQIPAQVIFDHLSKYNVNVLSLPHAGHGQFIFDPRHMRPCIEEAVKVLRTADREYAKI
jgi:hypothetical protein